MQKLRETHLHQLTKMMAKHVVVFAALVVVAFVGHRPLLLQVQQRQLKHQKVVKTKQLLQNNVVRHVHAHLVQPVLSVPAQLVFLQRMHQLQRLWKRPETVKTKHVWRCAHCFAGVLLVSPAQKAGFSFGCMVGFGSGLLHDERVTDGKCAVVEHFQIDAHIHVTQRVIQNFVDVCITLGGGWVYVNSCAAAGGFGEPELYT